MPVVLGPPRTALTGQLGLNKSQLGLVQLGGPAYAQSFDRLLPSSTRPLIGHAYQTNGVYAGLYGGVFSILNRPNFQATTANGGFNQVLINLEKPIANMAQGNVIRISEQGGDGNFIYSGIVEDIPDSIRPDGVDHQLLLSPAAYELDDTYTQLLYTQPTDITQMVRDAISLTNHLHCDQVSVPAYSGIFAATTGQVDFRNQSVKEVLDTARSIAGPTWFWFVDENFRVWLQPMGSAAAYTIPRSQYEERTKAASIQNRKNRVTAVGGVPTGGSANIQTTVNDLTSQVTIGIRTLNPPLSIPNITDATALAAIAGNVLTVLDRVWNRVNLKVLPTFGKRIHASQPGGAMIRYWEPNQSPLQEGVQGSGGYTGPYIAQTIDNDGLYQRVVAGDIPVTSQNDITNMVNRQVARAANNSLQVTAAALNLNQQVVTGTFVSSSSTVVNSSGANVPGTLWSLNQSEFQAIDAAGVTRAEMGNLPAVGISPAQWGMRANDSGGNPIFDSAGLINVMSSLGISSQGPGQTITATAFGAVSPSITVTFTISRTSRLLIPFFATAKSTVANKNGYVQAYLVGIGASGSLKFGGGGGAMDVTNGFAYLVCAPGSTFGSLAAGTYTARIEAKVDVGGSMYFDQGFLEVWLLGS